MLIQPSGDSGSSGLLLPWLHHSYSVSHLPLQTREPLNTSSRGKFPSEMHTASAHTQVSVRMCQSHRMSAGIAVVSQLAAVCQKYADVHMHT